MVEDQLAKMKAHRPNNYFLLSWTLTQDIAEAVCGTETILKLAASTYPALYLDLLPACSPSSYPNIIYVDALDSKDVAALAMAVNTLFPNYPGSEYLYLTIRTSGSSV